MERDKDFKDQLISIDFDHLGAGWYANKSDNIRIRLWKNNEVDFWLWKSSQDTDENELRFRGRIYSIEEFKWILDRCFN